MRYITAPFRWVDEGIKLLSIEATSPSLFRVLAWAAIAFCTLLSITVIVTSK